MRRKVHTSLNKELYLELQLTAKKLGVDTCDLLEVGMQYILEKYDKGELNEYNSKLSKQ